MDEKEINLMNYEFVKNEFEKYIEKYDKTNGSINLKIIHSFETVKRSEYIAKRIGLSEEDITLAKIIALLHDIGRFEQLNEFGDFDDKKFEHAGFGCKILFGEKKLIRKFIFDDQYDNIIEKAIYNHNKENIEMGLDERALLHSKIIRDADKIDNFRVEATTRFEDSWPGIYNPKTVQYEKISDSIYNCFLNHKKIYFNDRKTMWDYYLCIVAFVFELNYKASMEYLVENNFINILFEKVEALDDDTIIKMKKIKENVLDYINSSLNKE